MAKNNQTGSPSLSNVTGAATAGQILVGKSDGKFIRGSLTSSGGTITVTNPSPGVINVDQAGGSTGDVVGPVSAVDKTISRFNGTTGKIIQGSGVEIDDSDNLKTPTLLEQICFPNADYVTTSNISTTDITSRVVYFNPVSSGQVFSFSNASSINAAAGGLKLNTSFSSLFVNKSNIAFTLAAPFGDVDTSGMPSLVIGPKQAFYLEFFRTQISPVLVSIVGGYRYDGIDLNADNVFTGDVQTFEEIITTYANITGPANITSSLGFNTVSEGPFTSASFTLTGVQLKSIIILLNGSLATQDVFMPTGSDFESAILASFPVGATIAPGTTFWLKVLNNSGTATATLMANTDFLIGSAAGSVILPGSVSNVLIQKTGLTEYTTF